MIENQMTQEQATDEALLLFIRKVRRLAPGGFEEVWARLPEGARTTLLRAEARADVYRDTNTPVWPAEPDLDEATGEE